MDQHSLQFFVAAYIDGLGVRAFQTPGHVSKTCFEYLNAKNPKCLAHYESIMGAGATPQNPVVCPYGFVTTKPIGGLFPPVVLSGLSVDSATADQMAGGLAKSLTVLAEQLSAAVQRREYEHLEAAFHDVRHLNAAMLQHCERLLGDEGFPLGKEWDLQKIYADPKLKRMLSMWNASRDLANALSVHELSRDPKRASDEIVDVNLHKIFYRQVQVASEQLRTRKLRVNLGACSRELRLTKSFRLLPKILIDNAIKYAKEGTEIDIRFEETPSSIRIYVKSFGVLIRPAEAKMIFFRGYRGTNQGVTLGSGLGLWVGKTIAEANYGKIDVELIAKSKTYQGLDEGETIFRIVITA